MKCIGFFLIAVAIVAVVVSFSPPASGRADEEAAPLFGIKIPPGYREWRLISVAHEEGTQKNTPRRAAGYSLNSKTANPPTRRCSKPASLATCLSKLATLFLPVTHLNSEKEQESLGWPRLLFRGIPVPTPIVERYLKEIKKASIDYGYETRGRCNPRLGC
jgi:hypothetical protein